MPVCNIIMYLSLANVQAMSYAITPEVPIVSVFVCHPFVLIDLNYLYEKLCFLLKSAFH